MFEDNKKQFVNILIQDKQVKIDYKSFQDQKLVKEENSSFLLNDDLFNKDASFKINSLFQDIPKTYIATLYNQGDEKIVDTQTIDQSNNRSVPLCDKLSIAIDKNKITKHENYYGDFELDYIFSPFSVLNELIKKNTTKNTINLLIYNNFIYLLLLDHTHEIVLGKTIELTPFDKVKNSNFYTDEIIGQKLYDEVYFLELQQALNDILQDYYETKDDVEFIEDINIYYNVKQLHDEQIDSLKEGLIANVSYKPVSINEYLYILSLSKSNLQYNFTKIKEKKNKNSKTIQWVALAVGTLLLALFVLYSKIQNNQEEAVKIEKPKVKEIIKKEPVKIEKKEVLVQTKFIDHTLHNKQMIQIIKDHLNIIPDDILLNKIEIEKNSSTYLCNFLSNSTTPKELEDSLLKIYKSSKTILKHENDITINGIITNNIPALTPKEEFKVYNQTLNLSISQITDYIKTMINENSKIKLESKDKKEYTTFKFSISTNIKNPSQIYTIIDKLNKQNYPLSFDYPITIQTQSDRSLELNFNINYYQK